MCTWGGYGWQNWECKWNNPNPGFPKRQVPELYFKIPVWTVCGWVETVWGKKITGLTNVRKIRKINWASSGRANSFKLGEENPLPSILRLQFTNCVKFWKKLFAIRFPYKHLNFWPLCLPIKMTSKTMIRSIVLHILAFFLFCNGEVYLVWWRNLRSKLKRLQVNLCYFWGMGALQRKINEILMQNSSLFA